MEATRLSISIQLTWQPTGCSPYLIITVTTLFMLRISTLTFNKLLGWFDNDRFGVVLKNGQMVTAMKDGSSFIQRTWPGLGEFDIMHESDLLPDRKTIFARVGNEFFFRDAPTGTIRKVGNRVKGTCCAYLTPSPNGRLISYQEPEAGREGNDGRHYELWVQELATDFTSPADRKRGVGHATRLVCG